MAKSKSKAKSTNKKPDKPAKAAKKPVKPAAKPAKAAPVKPAKAPVKPAPADKTKGKMPPAKAPLPVKKPASLILSLAAGSKPEWGVKRICPSCTARFYDMKKDPIICPKCETEIDPEVITKSRRGRGAAAAAAAAAEAERLKKKKIAVSEDDEDIEIEDLPEIDADDDEAEEGGEEVIEDTGDLGEEEEELATVITDD